MLENTAEINGKSILEIVLNNSDRFFLTKILAKFLSVLFVIFGAIST
jgi:hypothetical protein